MKKTTSKEQARREKRRRVRGNGSAAGQRHEMEDSVPRRSRNEDRMEEPFHSHEALELFPETKSPFSAHAQDSKHRKRYTSGEAPELFPDTVGTPSQSVRKSIRRNAKPDDGLPELHPASRPTIARKENVSGLAMKTFKGEAPELFPDSVARASSRAQQESRGRNTIKPPSRSLDDADDFTSMKAPSPRLAGMKSTGLEEYDEMARAEEILAEKRALAAVVPSDELESAKGLELAPALDVPEPETQESQSSILEQGIEGATAANTMSSPDVASSSVRPGAVFVRGIDATDDGDDDYLVGDERTVTSGYQTALPEAQTVVNEEDGLFEDLARAELVAPSELDKQQEGGAMGWIKRHKVLTAVVVIVIAGAVAGGVVGATRGGGGGGSGPVAATISPTMAPTSAPTSAPTFTGFDLVASTLSTITPMSVLTNPTTPQNRAVEWLLREDQLAVDFENGPKLLQRYALATIYFATNGANWTRQLNFLSNQSECEWNEPGDDGGLFGVQSCTDQGLVDAIQLSQNELSGTLPDEVSGIVALRLLSAAINGLTGTLPLGVASLTDLDDIRLFENKLTGPIPEDIGNLGKMTHLELRTNTLTGQLPSSIGLMTDLINLLLYENRLSGPLPSTLGNLAGVKVLLLNTNQLSGTIPNEVSGMTSLLNIRLDENNFVAGMDSFCTIGFNIFWSDCLAIDQEGLPNVDAEVECSCCSICCEDETGNCLANTS